MEAELFLVKIQQKLDRSAAYVSRYLAKNIVSSGLTDKCLIQLSYAIGISKPLSIFVKLGEKNQDKITRLKKLLKIILTYRQEEYENY